MEKIRLLEAEMKSCQAEEERFKRQLGAQRS